LPDHSASQVTISIEAPDRGVFVKDLEIYLGNCDTCGQVGLSYELFFIPVYSDSNSVQTGIDTYVTFSKPISFVNNSQFTVEAFANSFTFEINGNVVRYEIRDISRLTDPDYR
jgi:hypothetical protein